MTPCDCLDWDPNAPAGGREGDTPHLGVIARDLAAALRGANLIGLAAQVSYSLIFAMPSILLAVALLAHIVDERTGFVISDEVRSLIVGGMPAEVRPTITTLLDDAMAQARQGPTTVSASVAILVALTVAGNGLSELATAFDRAAGIVDHRSAWLRRVIFTVSAVLIAVIMIGAFALYNWGGDLMALATLRVGVQGDWAAGWRELQAPVITLLVFLGLTLLYMTSSGRYVFRQMAPGAALGTLLWWVVVNGFQLYLGVTQPGSAYGAASSALVFLVFLFFSSMALIIGAMGAAVTVRHAGVGIRPDVALDSVAAAPSTIIVTGRRQGRHG
jgi:membrane protein